LTDESYIKLTLEIAKKGIGLVSPNPLVGCIIVKDNRIIGAGFHQKFGQNHAEINAIENATEVVEGSTLYVNLEPCVHYGKTPPCVDKIIEKKIKRVVIGTLDMNPLVSGKGVKKLLENGVEVKVGLLENECIDLNRFFFKYITKKIPYVTLKIAQTIDGKIADVKGNSKWITSKQARRYVHLLRAKYDAVLVGSNTIQKDNPLLTVRFTEGRNPKRIILDTKLGLNPNYKIFNTEKNIYIITSKDSEKKKRKIKTLLDLGVKIIFVPTENRKISLLSALTEIVKENVASILVEGGSQIFTSFIKQNLFDEMRLFISPKLLGKGLNVINDIGINSINQSLKLKINNFEKVGDDLVIDLRK